MKNHAEAYRIMNNALVLLKNSGLIDYEEVYVNKVPYKRLNWFGFEVKGLDG